jgi:uncharacterized membrane protein
MLFTGPRPALRRLVASVAASAVTALVLAWVTSWQMTMVTSWCAGGGVFVATLVPLVVRADGDMTRQVATVEDESRASSNLILLASSTVSLVGVGLALSHARHVHGTQEAVLTAFATLTVVISWFVVHLVFTLHYAHRYYSPPIGGVTLRGADQPAYVDFAYLAFTIGMTFQVADTELQHPEFRRAVLGHSLLSYLFGAVILAATVNIVASTLS